MPQEHREQQRELYGAPLAELMGTVQQALGLNQAKLAGALGLSAPMLSQLISAQRVKIGNPIVVERLRALLDLSERAQDLTAEQRHGEIDRIRAEVTTVHDTHPGPTAAVARALRQTANAAQLGEAADRLSDMPQLAALLRSAAAGY
ncbi:MAG: DNA-binding protein [Nostocoides sp.]